MLRMKLVRSFKLEVATTVSCNTHEWNHSDNTFMDITTPQRQTDLGGIERPTGSQSSSDTVSRDVIYFILLFILSVSARQ